MTLRTTCVASIALVGLALCSTAAFAQATVPATTAEAQLQQRVTQFPREIGALLDLAKLYFDQRRFDDASRTLAQASAVIQREQLSAVRPVTTAPPTSPFRTMVDAQGAPVTVNMLDAEDRPLRVGGDIKEPRKIKDVAPVYPDVALQAKISGYVIIEAIIGRDGLVRDAKVIKSNALLDQAALDAVRQWVYTPTLLNGQPVSVVMSMTVIFSLK